MAGDLAESAFQRAKRLGRTRTSRLRLHPTHALGGARLLSLELVHSALETGGDGDLFTLGLSQTRESIADGMVDAGNGGCVAALGGFDALGQAIQGDGHAANFIGRMLGDLHARRRIFLHDFQISAVRRALRTKVRSLTIALDDHPIEPLAQSHAGATREVLCDLSCLGVYPLNAPWRCRRHANRSPRT